MTTATQITLEPQELLRAIERGRLDILARLEVLVASIEERVDALEAVANQIASARGWER